MALCAVVPPAHSTADAAHGTRRLFPVTANPPSSSLRETRRRPSGGVDTLGGGSCKWSRHSTDEMETSPALGTLSAPRVSDFASEAINQKPPPPPLGASCPAQPRLSEEGGGDEEDDGVEEKRREDEGGMEHNHREDFASRARGLRERQGTGTATRRDDGDETPDSWS
ncbi:unnamed protein product [Lampetra planeri]